ncbi:MAG: tripartite tricarboxylate transporter substrate binding protein [Betaproteobacteria bacterium]|nr:tripartite tricarboxylate transporter substrate binding protein [Betaproteobacteria bacterium]
MLRLLAVIFLLQSVIAHAQSFPNKPLRIIVPYAPGGLLDLTARQIAASLPENLGQTVVVENRTGAASAVAVEVIKQAPADGHTILLDNSGLIITPILNPKAPFKMQRDLEAVSIVTGSTSLLAVNAALPARDLKELVSLARAKPGTLNYSSAGVGTILHMSGEMLKTLAKIDLVHVPYKGGSAAMNDVVSGQIHMIFLGSSILAPFIKDGRVRAIASTGLKRIPAYPDVPTIAESGYPDYDIVSWIGLFVVKATPPDIVARLSQGVNAILAKPDFRAALVKNSLEPIGATGDEARRLLELEELRWTEVIRVNKLKPE